MGCDLPRSLQKSAGKVRRERLKAPKGLRILHVCRRSHLYAVAVTSLQALDDRSHHVVVFLGDIEADILNQLLLLIYVYIVGRDVAVRLLGRFERHLDAVHLLRDHRHLNVLRRVFGLCGQKSLFLGHLFLLFLFPHGAAAT